MSKNILVFCGNRDEFEALVESEQMNGVPKYVHFVHVSQPSKAYGYVDFDICKYGTWEKHDWMHDVIEDLEHRKALQKKGGAQSSVH